MNVFLNAAPKINLRGVEDVSGRVAPAVQLERPQHMPLVYTFAKKGKPGLQFLSPANAALVYGADSFDERGPYATHATPLINILAKNGNMSAFQRLVPPGASTASLRFSADVLGPVPVQQYELDELGNFKLDKTGAKIETDVTRDGYIVKFVKSDVTVEKVNGVDISTFGVANSTVGNQTRTVGQDTIQSTRIPLFDMLPPDFGDDGNNRGVAIWASSERDLEVPDSRLLTTDKSYPFRIAQISRPSASETGKTVRTNYNEDYLELSLRPKAYNKRTDQEIYLGKNFLPRYQTLNDPNVPEIYGNVEKIAVYDANIAMLLEAFMTAEIAADDTFMHDEFVGNETEWFLFNLFGATNIEGQPYFAYQINTTDPDAAIMSRNSHHYMVGGADGEMTLATFDNAVKNAIVDWSDPQHEFSEILKYPVRVFYDTGFTLDTKYAILSFMGNRKDLVVGMTPHTVGEPKLTASQESSRALAIQTRARLYPESTYHGTSTMRCFIMGRSGTKVDSRYDGELPVLLEIIDWLSAMMGAGHGRWKADKVPDRNPLNMIKSFTNINATFVPGSAQATDWNNGLNWVAAYDTKRYYVPSLQTVYPDDTSILNSIFAAFACAEINYAGARVHSNFSGSTQLTQGEFREAVTKDYVKQLDRIFGGMFDVTVETNIDEGDQQRGYSWHNLVRIAGDTPRTVMTLDIRAERRSEQP